ncbi:MAG: extracellular solute-binding protein [Clostridia bacterium]|nr:extracellular solute-binding protein [Clostridia bacterium]
MKKLISLILATAMAATLLTACGEKVPEPVKSKVSHVYKTTEVALPEKVTVSKLFPADDGITLLCWETVQVDEETTKSQQVLFTMNRDGALSDKQVVEPSVEGASISNLCPTPDGGFLVLESQTTIKDNTRTIVYSIVRDGEVLCDDVSAIFESTGENSVRGGGSFYLRNLVVDGDGNIYLSCDYAVAVCDSAMNKLFEIEFNGYMSDMGNTSDGRVWAQYVDYSDGYSDKFCYIDPAKRDFGEDVPVPEMNLNNADIYVGPGYDLYINDNSSVYGFDASSETSEPVELLNWINSDIIASGIQDMAILDAETFVASYYEYLEEGSIRALYLLEQVPEEEIPEKYVIRFAMCDNGSGEIHSKVVRFNRNNEEYRVVLDDYSRYSTDEDYSRYNTVLQEEILAGNIPDVINLGAFSDMENYISDGIFADLYTFMDNDETFDRTAFFDCVLTPFERDGKLYEFVTKFAIGTIAAKRSNVSMDGWNGEEFVDYANSLSGDVYIIDEMTQEISLLLPLICSLDSFIDYETGTCSFDSDAFRKVLEFAKNTSARRFGDSLTADEQADYQNDRYKALREDRVILYPADITSIRSYVQTLFSFGFEDVNFVGYPTENGNGALIRAYESYAISGKSLVQEGAWQFLKYLTENQGTERGGSNYGFPSLKTAFDAVAEQMMEMHYFFKFSGGTNGWSGEARDYGDRYKKSDGILRDITEEDVENLKKLFDGVQREPDLEGEIVTIINEEAAMYFAGDKSLEETAEIIQSRVSRYVAENS